MKPLARRKTTAHYSKPPSSRRDGKLTSAAVARWRRMASMTREALADLCDKSVSTVERWERGMTEPTISDVRRMQKKQPGIVRLLFGGEAT